MTILLLSVVAPIIVSPAVAVLSQKWRRGLMLTYIAGLLFLAFYLLAGAELGSYTLFADSAYQLKTNLTLFSFSEHPYSKIAGFGFLFVGAIGLLYGLDVSRPGEQAVSLGAIASAVGVCFADNFITFLFFWETLTLTTAALVFLRRTPHAVRMAYRMLFFSLMSGFSLLVGVILQYNATGTFELMYPVAGLSFFILGIGIKTAFLPLYFWVPWGYPAANFPCSVLLAALCTKVGVYAVARILPPSNFIITMGACMAVFAVTMALFQSNLRRFLSYHIISQVGYMVAAVGLGISLSVDGGLLHLLNHMIYKALLFMSVGALIFTVGTENFQELHYGKDPAGKEKETSPLWKALPVAFIGALVGSLAISGTPLFNGYVSKYLIKNAVHGLNLVEMLLLITSVGTVLCFCKFIYFGFIKTRAEVQRKLTFSMQAAMVILTASCLITGIWPQSLATILPHNSSLDVYSVDGIKTALLLLVLGIGAFVLLARVLEKEIKSSSTDMKLVLNSTLSEIYGNLFNAISAIKNIPHRLLLGYWQRLNLKMEKIKVSQFVSATSIDFDVLLIMGMLGVVLVFLFYLQFGIFGVGV
jgi:multicomponent Na+:H+ antiporter subunit D